MCPACITYCPICEEPLSAREIANSPADDYPTHYACRVWMQEEAERLDDIDLGREYHGPYPIEEDESCS
jgi:hypothetical protein